MFCQQGAPQLASRWINEPGERNFISVQESMAQFILWKPQQSMCSPLAKRLKLPFKRCVLPHDNLSLLTIKPQ